MIQNDFHKVERVGKMIVLMHFYLPGSRPHPLHNLSFLNLTAIFIFKHNLLYLIYVETKF
jgi:hypothetical protein